jgi:pimeloyl-ACP methyl ester carboxylesterase
MDSLIDSTDNIKFLFPNFNCLQFDLPGHGDSGCLDTYSVEIYTKITEKLISELSISNLILIGHSMGATIALALYKSNPAIFSKIILIDPILKSPKQINVILPILHLFKLFKLLKILINQIRRLSVFQNYWNDTYIGLKSSNTNESRISTVTGILKTDIKAIIDGINDEFKGTIIAKPPVMDNKIFAIYGTEDPVIDRVKLIKCFKQNHIFEIPGGKHVPNRTNSLVFNKRLHEILQF